MSRIFSDKDLLSWEAYASGGAFGLPDQPKIIFHCLSDPDRRARFIRHRGDNADAEREVHDVSEDVLRTLLDESQELD